MKVVLLETIDGLGEVGSEVRVKDGFARNFLIPKGKAMEATDPNLKAFRDKIKARIKKETRTKNKALMLAEKLSELNISFTVKTGKEGKLFGSITNTNIHEALQERGFDVDKKKIMLGEPIRHIGSHEVMVKLYPNVTAKLKIEVKEEE